MSTPVITGTYLDRILNNTRAEVEQRKRIVTEQELLGSVAQQDPAISMFDALRHGPVGVIAEVKRASPSKGLIAGNIAVSDVAQSYIQGGCSAISVLTDKAFFQGSLSDLREVADIAHNAATPVLRKDFIVDHYQILEARSANADCVLLIAAALHHSELKDFYDTANDLGMDALIEVHDEDQLELALAISPTIIGINNRDLTTFDVDLNVTERLAPGIPDHVAIVGESGVRTREDLLRLGSAGVDAVLVGESLMRQPDRIMALQELLR